MNMPENKEPKKYKVLCWGDCKKFPELGDRCYLSFADDRPRAYEGQTVDHIPAVSVGWLLKAGMIEEAKGGK
jgi:hypothetical protein